MSLRAIGYEMVYFSTLHPTILNRYLPTALHNIDTYSPWYFVNLPRKMSNFLITLEVQSVLIHTLLVLDTSKAQVSDVCFPLEILYILWAISSEFSWAYVRMYICIWNPGREEVVPDYVCEPQRKEGKRAVKGLERRVDRQSDWAHCSIRLEFFHENEGRDRWLKPPRRRRRRMPERSLIPRLCRVKGWLHWFSSAFGGTNTSWYL